LAGTQFAEEAHKFPVFPLFGALAFALKAPLCDFGRALAP
jgi:hypothetical protein